MYAAVHVSRACLWLHVTDSGGAAAQEPRQKVLDRETAAQMLRIALPRTEPHLGAPCCAPPRWQCCAMDSSDMPDRCFEIWPCDVCCLSNLMAELRLHSQPVKDMHQSKHGAGKCGLCCACRGSRNCVLGWRAEPFTRFLSEQSEYKVLSLDQWVGFLRFTQEVRGPMLCAHFHMGSPRTPTKCAQVWHLAQLQHFKSLRHNKCSMHSLALGLC